MVSEKSASWWKRGKRRITRGLASTLVPLVYRLVALTWRYRVIDPVPEEQERSTVFGMWHESIPAGAYLHRKRGHTVMISTHHDGEIITRLVEQLGYQTARGSSSRGGLAAVRAMLRDAREARGLVMTPDGPRGPARSVAPGSAYLAAATGRSLVAVGFAVSRAWRAASWDRMIFPKPFARIVAVFASPLPVERSAARDEAGLDAAGRALEGRFEEAHDRAERELERWISG